MLNVQSLQSLRANSSVTKYDRALQVSVEKSVSMKRRSHYIGSLIKPLKRYQHFKSRIKYL